MTPAEIAYFESAKEAATLAEHPYPDVTAAEACLESDFGLSATAMICNNPFNLQTARDYDFLHPRKKLGASVHSSKPNKLGALVMGWAFYVVFPDLQTCLEERFKFLQFRAQWDSGITEALRIAEQKDETNDNSAAYIVALSRNLKGAEDRAAKVLEIRNDYFRSKVDNSLVDKFS